MPGWGDFTATKSAMPVNNFGASAGYDKPAPPPMARNPYHPMAPAMSRGAGMDGPPVAGLNGAKPMPAPMARPSPISDPTQAKPMAPPEVRGPMGGGQPLPMSGDPASAMRMRMAQAQMARAREGAPMRGAFAQAMGNRGPMGGGQPLPGTGAPGAPAAPAAPMTDPRVTRRPGAFVGSR